MKNFLLRLACVYCVALAVMVAAKPLFMLAAGGYDMGQCLAVISHGLSMDRSVAAYLTVLPAIAAIFLALRSTGWLRVAMRWYFGIVSTVTAMCLVADAALYPYWGFKLDVTPIFYFTTSPAAAMASVPWWEWAVGAVVIAVISFGMYKALTMAYFAFGDGSVKASGRWLETAGMVVVTALLFLPIRGGVTVSTMNPSRAYFSPDIRLNHAAVNPVFSLMYSAAHQGHFDKQFRFMADAEADAVMGRLAAEGDSVPRLGFLPDIHLIILESFSAHLLPGLGGDSVAMRLDSIAAEGWLWTDAYASSFRTDRGVPAALCGYPGPPTTSLLKYVNKLDGLPSLPSSLKRNHGYDMTYYYGGDINFTNLNALLVAAGFDRIVSDRDFPVGERLSKWGVHDDRVFARAAADAKSHPRRGGRPRLTVVQTSSSHEPFEVPYASRFENKKLNAFAYADSCLGAYVDELKRLPDWDSTLVVIVPDHYGSWPEGLVKPRDLHHVPLVFAGGAIRDLHPDSTLFALPASQTDIAATVLALLGDSADEFRFSRNLLDPAREPFAFFSRRNFAAMRHARLGDAVLSMDTNLADPESSDSTLVLLKAYLQIIYTDLSQR